jgi:histidine kinase-like protein
MTLDSIYNFFLSALALANIILSSAIIIVSFSLFLYLFANNLRNSVARSFSALLFCLTIVYIGDVLLQRVDTFSSAVVWLKFKWIGIAFVPAAYLHFSDALLRAAHAYSLWRRIAVRLAYLVSAAFLLLVTSTDLVVREGFFFPVAVQFHAGPLFWLFAVFFFTLSGWGLLNLREARERSISPTTRRRMTYLGAAFFAPALGVFPYLIIAGFPPDFPPLALLGMTLLGKIGVAVMVLVMSYTVAYQGALSPDRIIKHNLVHYLLRGPFAAIMVVGLLFAVPPVERLLGLTRETVLFAVVIAAIVIFELAITLSKPFLDRLIFWNDREELNRFEEIDKRLLTTSDLHQLLENILSAACDLVRVRTGFVAIHESDQWKLQMATGQRERVRQFFAASDLAELGANRDPTVSADGFWLWFLRAKTQDVLVGVMGIEARGTGQETNAALTDRERDLLAGFADQVELALEDRLLQQGIFSLLEQITEEIELLQRARAAPRYAGEPASDASADQPAESPTFHRAVKDALDHYWGGPKLTENPLLKQGFVRSNLDEYDGDAVNALRSQIAHAIESLRPNGARSFTAPEWLLYNILELKVIQGKKIREIALQLAMSESDVYRKQRVAIQKLAQRLAAMK